MSQGAQLLEPIYDAQLESIRRSRVKAVDETPIKAGRAEPGKMKMIGKVYEVEAAIRERSLSGERKRLHWLEHAKPLVEQFFAWVDEQLARQGLLPSNKLTQALVYARERKAQLMAFLGDEQVPMDTNHLERALRPVRLGRKNWLFCWTAMSRSLLNAAG